MENLIENLRELQHVAQQAGEEIANLKRFTPKDTQIKIVNIMAFIEDVARQLDDFFEELQDNGSAVFTLEFCQGANPFIILGDEEKTEKIKPKKPAKKKEISKKKSQMAA